ncbi:MAG: hypothetical protein O8C55_05505 [Candidatus Methanoperedens sp.]|nr:hypothetical protein [Candidatus Methanoperedens sp.]
MAKYLIDRSYQIASDEFIDVVVIAVPNSKQFPNGIKYGINFRVYTGHEWIELIRYDNAHGIGEHRHMFGEIKPTGSMRPEDIITEMIQIINERRSEINEIKSRKK